MHPSIPTAAALALICAQAAAEPAGPFLSIDLNAQTDGAAGCMLTFTAQNDHATAIDRAVFETVLFDTEGRVDRLTLLDFGELPAGKLRVRQFQMDGIACEALGRVLINGASTCTVGGADSPLCADTLKLGSSTGTELIG